MPLATLLLAALLSTGGTLSLGTPAASDARVQLTLTAARHWPAATTIRIDNLGTGDVRTQQLTAAEAGELRAVTLAPGRYRITISAERLASVYREVTLAANATADLGSLALGTLPRIRGRVLDATGAPLPAAEIHAGPAEARSDAAGAYELEPAAGQWPEFVTIAARARGTRVLDVPKSTADVDLPAVTLAPPARLRITLTERPAGDLSADLQILTASEQLAVVRRARLAAGKNTLDFDNLGSGAYVLLLRGPGPLQQHATKIILGTGDDRREELAIHPLPFTARITMGGEPLPDATIAMRNRTFQWHGDLHSDAAGRVSGEIWQPGEFAAEYRGSTAASTFLQAVTLASTAPVTMNLDLARREVRGQVLDVDGFPVAGAKVFLRTDTDDTSSTVRTESAPDGRYAFEAVAAGEQFVTIVADDYLIPDEQHFTMHPADTLRDVPIRLDPGTLRTLRVRDAAGHPPIAADVIAVSNGTVRALTYTDQEGRARVPLPKTSSVIFVLARDGAFTAVRPTDEDLAITLPAPVSSLEITTRTTTGQPLSNINLLVAYAGEPLPLEVARRYERAHGPLRTDDAGELLLRNIPAGTYQFWPYATESEAESLLASGSAAPITVNVKAGENAIVVDFQAK